MKTWQILLAPAVLLLLVVIQKSQLDGDKHQPMDAQNAPKIQMLEPVQIENGKATGKVLLTYPDGKAERCVFGMAMVKDTGGTMKGFTLRPNYQKCLPAT